MEIRDKEELQDKARGNKQGFLKHIFFGVIFWGGDKFAEIQYQKKSYRHAFFFFFLSRSIQNTAIVLGLLLFK